MADLQRKITFSAEDGGFTSVLQKLGQSFSNFTDSASENLKKVDFENLKTKAKDFINQSAKSDNFGSINNVDDLSKKIEQFKQSKQTKQSTTEDVGSAKVSNFSKGFEDLKQNLSNIKENVIDFSSQNIRRASNNFKGIDNEEYDVLRESYKENTSTVVGSGRELNNEFDNKYKKATQYDYNSITNRRLENLSKGDDDDLFDEMLDDSYDENYDKFKSLIKDKNKLVDKAMEEALKEVESNINNQQINVNKDFKQSKEQIDKDFKTKFRKIDDSDEDPETKREKKKTLRYDYEDKKEQLLKERDSDSASIDDLLSKLEELKDEFASQKQQEGKESILGELREKRSDLVRQRELSGSEGDIGRINKEISKLDSKNRKLMGGAPDEPDLFDRTKSGLGKAGGKVGGLISTGTNAVLGSIGMASLFTIGGLIAKSVTEGKQLDESRGAINGLKKQGGGFGFGTAGFGVKAADFMGLARQTALSSGSAGDNLEKRTVMNIATEKAFGFNSGELAGMDTQRRTEKDNTDISKSILESVNYFRKSGLFNVDKNDFTLMHEKQDFMNRLNQDQAKQMERTNYTSSTQLVGAFGKIDQILGKGTSFGDGRQYEQISKINQSLTNPGNEFKQALAYRTLKQINPEADFFELQKMQEKGVFQQGYFSKMLGNLEGLAGNNDNYFFSMIKELTGMGAESSETLGKAFKKDRTLFDNIGNEEEVKQILSSKKGGKNMTDADVVGRGVSNTGSVSRMMATIDNLAAPYGEKGIKYLEEKMSIGMNQGPDALVKSFMTDIGSAFKTYVPKISDAVIDGTKEITKTLGAKMYAWLMEIGGSGRNTPFKGENSQIKKNQLKKGK